MAIAKIYVHVLTLAALSVTIYGYPEYIALIPNGLNLKDPCNPEITAHGVGHIDSNGRGPLNPFGIDFVVECRLWSQSLCRKDSDGDGLTNGEELGDPDCVWIPGATPARSTGLSHPGWNEKTLEC